MSDNKTHHNIFESLHWVLLFASSYIFLNSGYSAKLSMWSRSIDKNTYYPSGSEKDAVTYLHLSLSRVVPAPIQPWESTWGSQILHVLPEPPKDDLWANTNLFVSMAPTWGNRLVSIEEVRLQTGQGNECYPCWAQVILKKDWVEMAHCLIHLCDI